MQVDFVISKLKANALVLDNGLAESLAGAGIVGGEVPRQVEH